MSVSRVQPAVRDVVQVVDEGGGTDLIGAVLREFEDGYIVEVNDAPLFVERSHVVFCETSLTESYYWTGVDIISLNGWHHFDNLGKFLTDHPARWTKSLVGMGDLHTSEAKANARIVHDIATPKEATLPYLDIFPSWRE